MPERLLPLLLAPGWKRVAPRLTGRKLLWQTGGTLMQGETDFRLVNALGELGPTDCPATVDPVRRMVYAYTAPYHQGQKDASELRAWHLDLGTSSRLFPLGLNQWALWLFSHLPRHDAIFTLVATHMPGQGLNIQHQFGIFDLAKMKQLFITLPRDAFFPLDVHVPRREVLFYGAEGYQLIGFSGKRSRRLAGQGLPNGRGARFHPSEPWVLLGGDGIYRWHLEGGRIEQLQERGHYPVWDHEHTGYWYSKSSGDLFHASLQDASAERVVAVAGNSSPELRRASPVVPSADGRYLIARLTRRVKRSEDTTLSGEDAYRSDSCLCILDTQQKEVWQYPGLHEYPVWYEPITLPQDNEAFMLAQ